MRKLTRSVNWLTKFSKITGIRAYWVEKKNVLIEESKPFSNVKTIVFFSKQNIPIFAVSHLIFRAAFAVLFKTKYRYQNKSKFSIQVWSLF